MERVNPPRSDDDDGGDDDDDDNYDDDDDHDYLPSRSPLSSTSGLFTSSSSPSKARLSLRPILSVSPPIDQDTASHFGKSIFSQNLS